MRKTDKEEKLASLNQALLHLNQEKQSLEAFQTTNINVVLLINKRLKEIDIEIDGINRKIDVFNKNDR